MMRTVTRSTGVHDLVATQIVSVAMGLLADRGDLPPMAEVATAAGLGRATIYRYFPTREALIAALVEAAIAETEGLLEAADFAHAGLHEGLLRFARTMLSARTRFDALHRVFPNAEHGPFRKGDPRARLAPKVQGMFERGLADGLLRSDLTATQHTMLFVATVRAVASQLEPDAAVERTAAWIVDLYLNGAGSDGGDGGNRGGSGDRVAAPGGAVSPVR